MILIVSIVVYGAALGLLTRPAVRAVVVAVLSVGAAQYGAICLSRYLLRQPDTEAVAWVLRNYAGAEARDMIPTVLTAAFAATVAAFIAAMTQSSEQRRRVKRIAAIED